MSDLTMYTPGTCVWVKLHAYHIIWWPAKVIDLSFVSKEILEELYKKTKKQSIKVAVQFETDKTM